MRSPIVLVPACTRQFGDHPYYAAQIKYVEAVVRGAGCAPLILPALGDALDLETMLTVCDGIMLTGSASNVHPSHYAQDVLDPALPQDPARDATTLPLIRHSLGRGVPLFAICRGLQEVNVALGGTLHQLVHEVEGRWDHRSPKTPDNDVNYAPAHDIEIVEGGLLHRLLGERRVKVNSLHAQGVDRLATRARLEAVAEDGQVEAFSIPDAPAFALALQWHPEHRALENPVSMKLFDAFAAACRSRAMARLGPPLAAAAE